MMRLQGTPSAWLRHPARLWMRAAEPSGGTAPEPAAVSNLRRASSGSAKRLQALALPAPAGSEVMTVDSLRAWAGEWGISPSERLQRGQLMAALLRQAKRAGLGDAATLSFPRSVTLAYDAVTTLPAGLRVESTLCVAECPSLIALPRGLWVRGKLIAEGCARLVSIHASTQVGGALRLRGCARLTALPEGLIGRSRGRKALWDLRGTGLSAELAEKLGRFEHVEVDAPVAEWEVTSFATIAEAWAFWERACPTSLGRQTALPAEGSAALLRLCEAMQATAHYTQPSVRPSLAVRVRQLLVACADAELAVEVGRAIAQGLEQGDHPVSTLLPHIEESVAAHQALHSQNPEASLRAVGRAGLIRSLVAELACEHAARLSGCDSMELQIAYAAALVGSYPELAPVVYPRDQLAAVGEAERLGAVRQVHGGLAASEAAYVDGWPPLQRHLRQQAVDALDDAQLPVLVHALDADAVCPMTQMGVADLQSPIAVVHGGRVTVYERAALLTWWVHHGTDAMRQPIALTMLAKPAWSSAP